MKKLILISTLLYLMSPEKGRDSYMIFQKEDITILTNYKGIDSVSQVLHLFHGTPVLVDLWATWCEPCLDEFRLSPELYTFTKNKGIRLLYISIDDDSSDNMWKADIKKYTLRGYHLRSNTTFRNNIENLIWGAKGAYSIPHYLLFDQDGRLTDKALPQLSSGQSFYNVVQEELTPPAPL